MNGSYIETTLEEGSQEFGEQHLHSSTRYMTSLRQHSPSKRASSAISKTYKAASTLYLTRRLPEALQTIEPLISVSRPGTDEDKEIITTPPIATATRSLRVKVWNFYLTLCNAIIELGPEEGKAELGGAVWKGIVNKVRDGSIWEEVVQSGYGGRDGSVDADVVANLSTLLLGQSPTQNLNQQRLETYLSLSSQPELVLADKLHGYEDGRPEMPRRPSHTSGTNTPRDLNSRAKVLELYTLHVLPRNNEWDTSREFIKNSNELDEERKEAFLYTLDTLQDQARNEREREQELLRQRDEELARQRQEAEAKRLEESRLLEERSRASEAASQTSSKAASSSRGIGHERTNSEIDYGIEEPPKARKILRKKEGSTRPATRGAQSVTGSNSGTGGGGTGKGLPRAARPKKGQPRSVIQRLPALLALMQKLVAKLSRTLTRDTATLTRSLLFLFAFILAFARRDVRERIGRVAGLGWDKVKGTIGMGTKVSYI